MKVAVGGFLVWVVPFAVSCCLIGPDQKKVVNDEAFRTIMLITGSLTSSWCIYKCEVSSLKSGIQMAISWLVINWLLDLLVLVPLLTTEDGTALNFDNYMATVPRWFLRIGMAYVAFVSNCVVAGAVVERALDGAKKKK